MHLNIMTLALAGVLGLVLLWFTVRSTETWLIMAILSHLILFLHERGIVETTIYQAVAYSAIFFPGLFWWFTKRVTESRKIIDHWTELGLVAFVIFGLVSIGWATMYGFSLTKGIREFVLFLPYLMYFPLRDYVAENNEQYVVAALLFVALAVAVFNIVQYRLLMITAHYFWQIMGERVNLGEPLMMSSIIIMFGFIAAKKYNFYLVASLIAVSTIALVLTFSRGYWGAGFFGLLLLMYIVKGAPRKRMLRLVLASFAGIILVAAIVFPKLMVDLVAGLAVRLAQLGGRDLSLESRLAESAVVLDHFVRSPVIGYGMGAEFSFFNPINSLTTTTWYIHNGYLFMLYKFGVVGTILYLSFYLHMAITTAREAAGVADEETRILLYSFFCIMTAMLIVNLTSPQFYDRVALLILTVLWGISSGIAKRNRSSGKSMAVTR